jgi:hypothetical protein
MKSLVIFLFILLPIVSKADPEYSLVLRYLVNLPSETRDQEAIQGLKDMNVSTEAKKNVAVIVATTRKRYELAWWMTENGYVKLENIGSMFARPFADNHTPNRTQMSSRIYSDEELLEYAKNFISTGTKVTADDVQLINGLNYPKLAEYVGSLLSSDQTNELNVKTLRELLNNRPVNFEDVKAHVNATNVVVPADMLRYARIETVELTQFLIDHGADIHADDVLANGINNGSVEVVKFLLEKGASPCRNPNTKNDPLEKAEHFKKKAKSKERATKMKAIIKVVKPAAKNCAE